MKTLTIPNVMKIRIDNNNNEDIEIQSIEQLSSILTPLKYYEILRTYNDNTRKWAYYNAYAVTKKELISFLLNVI